MENKNLLIFNALFLGSKPNGFHLTEGKAESSPKRTYKTLLSDFMSLYLPPAFSAPARDLPFAASSSIKCMWFTISKSLLKCFLSLGSFRSTPLKHRAAIPVLPILLFIFPTALTNTWHTISYLVCRFSVSHPQLLPHEWVPLGQGLCAVLLTAIFPIPGIVPDRIGDPKNTFWVND